MSVHFTVVSVRVAVHFVTVLLLVGKLHINYKTPRPSNLLHATKLGKGT